MTDHTGAVIRWIAGAAILGYAVYDFANHQDRAGTWLALVVGGYLIVRGFGHR